MGIDETRMLEITAMSKPDRFVEAANKYNRAPSVDRGVIGRFLVDLADHRP
jgi:hypothetical protein